MPKKNNKHKNNALKKQFIKISTLLILTSFILIGILILLSFDKDTSKETITPEISSTKEQSVEKNISIQTQTIPIQYNINNIEPIKEEIKQETYSFYHDKNQSILLEENNSIEKTTIISPNTKKLHLPKLAIIIDDVSASFQVKSILNIGYPVTMAFLPPTNGHRNSAKIAEDLDFYMIHLPLEAGTRKFEEENTLRIGDSIEKIETRIKQIKNWYPNTKYINNHTGSKFTADYTSMDRLFKILKKYNYIFLDSKTTAKSVVQKVSKKYEMPYITRNIFLDNQLDKTYITKQLKKAIKIAKQRGQAIAIGHPHKITIQTLKDSKHLFKDIELVLINQL